LVKKKSWVSSLSRSVSVEEKIMLAIDMAISEAEKKVRKWLKRNKINIDFNVYKKEVSIKKGELIVKVEVEAPPGWKEIIETKLSRDIGDYLRNFLP